jgi:sugar O-acyltransferase (sialic acid O-acetyltransferase NeuD family)
MGKAESAREGIVIVGVRSPMIVDYEEVCRRAGLTIRAGVSVNGSPRTAAIRTIWAPDSLDPSARGFAFIACAFAPSRRKALHKLGLELGLTSAPAIIDPAAVVARSSRIGDGSFVNMAAVIGAMSLVGEGVLINRSASLGHHCIIDDFVSIGPGVTMAGNIRVGAGTVIGAGAVILPNVIIGANAVVAAGSVVRKAIADGTLVSGHPARPQRLLGRGRGAGAEGDEE